MSLVKWEKASNYAGTDFSDYFCGPGIHRDSDLLEQSNFSTALDMLGGESETVVVARCGHWAVGWTEQILVHSSDLKAVRILKDIQTKIEEYPVLDEYDFYEREAEYMDDTFENYKKEFIANAIENLKNATDIPLALLKPLEKSKAFEALVSEVYRYDCGYRGLEDGFVCEDTFTQHFDDVHFNWANSDITFLGNEIQKALGA